MISLIKFDLRRIFSNKMFYLLNIMTFLAFFILFHIDYLNPIENEMIGVDSSTKKYQQYFVSIETENKYLIDDYDHDVIIHMKDDQWIIHSKYQLSDTIKSIIERDIQTVIQQSYKDHHLFMYEYIEELNQPISFIYDSEKESDMELTIISTICFFLILNFAASLANEIIYEKASHFINILFIYITERQYIFAKVIESFIVPVVHLCCTSFILIINVLIRYFKDGFKGLGDTFELIESNQSIEITISISNVLMGLVIMIASLVLIQLIIMLIASRFTSSNQGGLFISFIYICLLLAYFLLLSFGFNFNYSSIFFKILSNIPILSMVLMPLRLMKGFGSVWNWLLSLLIINLTTLILIKCFIAEYKENMLNN